jgi:hypothetical protein
MCQTTKTYSDVFCTSELQYLCVPNNSRDKPNKLATRFDSCSESSILLVTPCPCSWSKRSSIDQGAVELNSVGMVANLLPHLDRWEIYHSLSAVLVCSRCVRTNFGQEPAPPHRESRHNEDHLDVPYSYSGWIAGRREHVTYCELTIERLGFILF